jgi:radical SAM protein with 4Fe4S-binding SPASM domain
MTAALVTRDTVLQPTSWCVVRPQKDQHLVYNSRTDEMHLVPRTGYLVYRLCDGLRSVGEIEGSVADALDDEGHVIHEVLTAFLGKMLARGILEVADDVPLGNIREAPFRDIWQSSPIVRLLQDRENLRGKCAGCPVRSRCGGCRAVAFAKTGDFLATDPRCWLPDGGPVACTLH